MNKYLLVGIASILVIAGGWWYFLQSGTPVIPIADKEIQKAEGDKTQSFKKSTSGVEALRIGNTIGALTVSSIKDTPTENPKEIIKEIKFTGTITIVGTSIGVMGDGGQMILKKSDNPKLPRFVLETDRDEVYFTTADNLPGDNEKYAVTISDYTLYAFVPSDPKAWNTDGGHIVSFEKAR